MSEHEPLESLESLEELEAAPPVWRSVVRFVVVVSLAVFLLWLCFRQVDTPQVMKALALADKKLLVVVLVSGHLLLFFLNSVAAHFVLKGVGLGASLGPFSLVLSALQLPGSLQVSLGGVGLLAYAKRRYGVLIRHGMSAFGLVYYADGLVFGPACLMGYWVLDGVRGQVTSIFGAVVAYSLFWVWGYFHKWWDGLWPKFLKGLLEIREWEVVRAFRTLSVERLVFLVGLRLAIFVSLSLIHFGVLKAFGVSVPLLVLFLVIPFTIFIGNLPVTFGGFGTTQAAMLYLLGPYGPKETILAYSLTYSSGILLLRATQGAITFRAGMKEVFARPAAPIESTPSEPATPAAVE